MRSRGPRGVLAEVPELPSPGWATAPAPPGSRSTAPHELPSSPASTLSVAVLLKAPWLLELLPSTRPRQQLGFLQPRDARGRSVSGRDLGLGLAPPALRAPPRSIAASEPTQPLLHGHLPPPPSSLPADLALYGGRETRE